MAEEIVNTGPQKTNYDLRLFRTMLVPSALSGMFCVVLSLFAVGSVLLVTNYQGSSFQQDVTRFQNRVEAQVVSEDYQQLSSNFEENIVVDRAPVMLFWMFVGAIVYFMLTGVIEAISSANNLEQELHFVHAQRKELLKIVYIKSAIRLVVLAIWFGYFLLFFRIILPYCLAASRVSGGNIYSVTGVLLAIAAIAILAISLHIHIIIMRLVALRPRLFSQETSF